MYSNQSEWMKGCSCHKKATNKNTKIELHGVTDAMLPSSA